MATPVDGSKVGSMVPKSKYIAIKNSSGVNISGVCIEFGHIFLKL